MLAWNSTGAIKHTAGYLHHSGVGRPHPGSPLSTTCLGQLGLKNKNDECLQVHLWAKPGGAAQTTIVAFGLANHTCLGSCKVGY